MNPRRRLLFKKRDRERREALLAEQEAPVVEDVVEQVKLKLETKG